MKEYETEGNISSLFQQAIEQAGYEDVLVMWGGKKDGKIVGGYVLPEDRTNLEETYFVINGCMFGELGGSLLE